MRCTFEFKSPDAGVFLVNGAPVAEISELSLHNIRFKPDGPILAGARLHVPLYWRQYHRHEDHDRSAARRGRLTLLSQSAGSVSLRCEAETESGSAHSRYDIMLKADKRSGGVEYHVNALLEIPEGRGWLVTYHAEHGDLEFLNFWPEDVFLPEAPVGKRYSCCCVLKPGGVLHIPHHHLDSRDKRNIVLNGGDMFAWLLENENPAVEIIAPTIAETGLCAYMWDAHFGVRICEDGQDTLLAPGRRVAAAYKLVNLSRHEGEFLLFNAESDDDPSLSDIPLFTEGVNEFERGIDTVLEPSSVWPWRFSGDAGSTGSLDTPDGRRGTRSLRVNTIGGEGRWAATTLGPAFGGAAFSEGARYRLSARVKAELLTGAAHISLRWHKSGSDGLHDAEQYECLSSDLIGPRADWTEITVVTEPIAPAADRMHILLECSGQGSCYFDAIRMEALPAEDSETGADLTTG